MKKATKPTLVYKIRNSLYINLTSACTAECFFCPRKTDPVVKGFDLTLWTDPSADEVIHEIGDPEKYDEIVFCGFGEPTLRLETLLEVSRWLKTKSCKVRINTNGHGNLIHKRNIAPDLADLIDEVSVSLNATSGDEYLRVVKPSFGIGTFEAVLEFIKECKKYVPKVTITAVAHPDLDQAAFKKIAYELGVPLRIRPYNLLG